MTFVDPKVFRTYDIRALVPDMVTPDSAFYADLNNPDSFLATLTAEQVEQIGRGLGDFLGANTVVIGHDARLCGPVWADALARGLARQGVNVIQIGYASSDMVYYASGKMDVCAVEITASHSPKELNGMKMVRPGARVIGMGSGMEELRDIVGRGQFKNVAQPGTITRRDLLDEYIAHLMQFIDVSAVKPFTIVADAGNGVGGPVAHALLAKFSQIKTTELFFDPDGNFPNHGPNPFEHENIQQLVDAVKTQGADFGVAWDGDADRVFFTDENGVPISGDVVTTLVARHFLKMHPGSTIVYDLRASWAVRDWVAKLGGRAVSERVGHSFIKQRMRAENGVFGGEVSGHYYFRDHFYADNGYIPLLSMLQMLSEGGIKMSELVASLGAYYISGEINSAVPNTQTVLERVQQTYADGSIDLRDGVTVEYPDWHFNVRPSANDPLVRLNLEARSQADMEQKRDELLDLIRRTD